LMFSCGKESSTTPTTPTPPPTPPTIIGVTVTSDHSTIVVGNTEQMTATVKMSDNTTKPGTGTWGSDNPSVAKIDQSGLVTGVAAGTATIYFDATGDGRATKLMTVRDIWKNSGIGATVFDMPTYVSRVRIRGEYTGTGQNFVVWVGNDLLVNEILGTWWGQTVYDGVHLTTGGVVQVKYSQGLSWWFWEWDPKNTALSFSKPQVWDQPVPGGEREFEIYKRTQAEGKR